MSNYRERPPAGPAPAPVDIGGADAPGDAPGDDDTGPDAEVETRSVEVDAAQHAGRVDKVLVALAPEFSRNHLQRLIDEGHVRLGDAPVRSAAAKVRCGQTVSVELWPTPESRAFRPEPMALDIVHEDEHLMVINKPAGLVVHPAAGNWSGTLLNGLLTHHRAAATLPRAGIVHRLDKDTSGLMVVGKTLQAVTALSRDIAAREVHREYLAITHGQLREAAMCINSPIGRDPRSRVRMAIISSGRASRTDVARIGVGLACSAVRCTLHTGRTHQIRVHLASVGHPLLADAVYGGRPLLELTRQALHATRLGFTHPIERKPLQFDAPPPADFAAAWERVLAGAA